MKKNGGSELASSLDDVMVEISDADNMHGILVPMDELKFLPRVGDTLTMPPEEDSTEKYQSYEVVDVNFKFGGDLTTSSRGKLLGISVGLKKLQ